MQITINIVRAFDFGEGIRYEVVINGRPVDRTFGFTQETLLEEILLRIEQGLMPEMDRAVSAMRERANK